MNLYAIQYSTQPKDTILRLVEADRIAYSGGDGVVVVAFLKGDTEIEAVCALQPGMIVIKCGPSSRETFEAEIDCRNAVPFVTVNGKGGAFEHRPNRPKSHERPTPSQQRAASLREYL